MRKTAIGFRAKSGRAIAVVIGAPDRKLESIGNSHIRAHAAEGVLFRRVLEVAARENTLPFITLTEKELPALKLDAVLKDLGRQAGTPWRADERAAAAAALMVISNRRTAKPRRT